MNLRTKHGRAGKTISSMWSSICDALSTLWIDKNDSHCWVQEPGSCCKNIYFLKFIREKKVLDEKCMDVHILQC